MPADFKGVGAIFLTGFMGCGKSTVGKLLAERLGWEFVDLDERIEALAGKSIARIFSEDGEDEFRRLEHETLVEQARLAREGSPRAAALGGGAFTFERNRRAISGAGVSIWLDAGGRREGIARFELGERRRHDPLTTRDAWQPRTLLLIATELCERQCTEHERWKGRNRRHGPPDFLQQQAERHEVEPGATVHFGDRSTQKVGGGESLPEGKGGPFRLLIPEDAADQPVSCANVKGVAKVVIRN